MNQDNIVAAHVDKRDMIYLQGAQYCGPGTLVWIPDCVQNVPHNGEDDPICTDRMRQRKPWKVATVTIDRTATKIAMVRKGYTIAQLADAAGLGAATVCSMLNGKPCKPSTAQQLANALGVRVSNISQGGSNNYDR